MGRALPGIFKAYLNINEVITAIMFNWIGLYMVNDIMYGKGKSPMYDLASTKTYSLRKAAPQAMIPSLGMSELFGKLQSVTIAIFIAIFFAIIVYIILNKTAFGYELRACGFNKNAARYAGINEKRNIILCDDDFRRAGGRRRGAVLSLHRRGVEPAGLHGAARDGASTASARRCWPVPTRLERFSPRCSFRISPSAARSSPRSITPRKSPT